MHVRHDDDRHLSVVKWAVIAALLLAENALIQHR